MLEDFRLRVFMKVAEKQSFTAAAHDLGISQPAVSQNISELEKNLGVSLFERGRRQVSLTDKGVLFKGYAEQILHWYRVAEDAFREPNVWELHKTPERPFSLALDEGSHAEIWSSQGDIHICIKKDEQTV